jgi:hypothetical protein
MPGRTYANDILETSQTLGIIDYVLAGENEGYRPFSDEFSTGDSPFYIVRNADETKCEYHFGGVYGEGPPATLTRSVVYSTNSNNAESWVQGDLPLTIYVGTPADALELACKMGLGTTRPPFLEFGFWVDEDDVAAGIHTKKLYDGTSDITVGRINTASHKFIPASTAINFPPGHIQGFTYDNNAGDPTNDIDINPGSCSDSTGVYPIVLAAAITKRLDAAWAVGTGNGGLLSGAISNTDYNIWAIARSDTDVVDIGYEATSSATPTLPANYTYYRKIGWFKRSGGLIVTFNTYELEGGGLQFTWKAKRQDISLANTLTTARRTDALSVPLNFSVRAQILVVMQDAAAIYGVYICCPDETDEYPTSVVFSQVASVLTGSKNEIRTSAAGLIASRASVTIDAYTVFSVGFLWSRR